MKILSTLFVRKNVPIFAFVLALLGFLGIKFGNVTSVILDVIDLPRGGELFFCSLKNEGVIYDEQGEVEGSENFADGRCGFGFISKKTKERVTFPVDGKFTYLKAGTIELCLTPQADFLTIGKDLCLINTAGGPNVIRLQLVHPNDPIPLKPPSVLRLRIKSGDGGKTKNNSRVFTTNKLEWEAGEHYHIACTWGKKGLHLYIDGKDVETKSPSGYKGPPENLSGRFVVNNTSPDRDMCHTPTHCIISNLVIHDAQLDLEDLGEKCPIRERWFPEK